MLNIKTMKERLDFINNSAQKKGASVPLLETFIVNIVMEEVEQAGSNLEKKNAIKKVLEDILKEGDKKLNLKPVHMISTDIVYGIYEKCILYLRNNNLL